MSSTTNTTTTKKSNLDTVNLCESGTSQSPINIDTTKVVACTKKCKLKLYYRSSRCVMINLGSEFTLNYDSGSFADFRGQNYALEQISFTRPSSHRVDGRSYEIEMLLYHKNTITKDILIISVFLEMNDAVSPSKTFLDQFVDYLPSDTRSLKELDLGADWNVFQLIPFDKSFYNYSGSILKTPCTQNTEWIIYRNPVNASTHFFDTIKARYPNVNNREANNAIGARVVYYNPNTEPLAQINYGSSEKCYTEQQFRSQCSSLSNNSEVVKQNKEALMYFFIMFCIFMATLFIMWLYERYKVSSIKDALSSGFDKFKDAASGVVSSAKNLVSKPTDATVSIPK
jgi:carbonic anhydrase